MVPARLPDFVDLGRGDRLDPVLEVEPADLLPQAVQPAAGTPDPVRVDERADLVGRALLVLGEREPLGLGQRLVDLDELTVRQPLDDAGLATVQHLVPVAALEAEADPLGDDEGDRPGRRRSDPDEPGDRVDRQVEVGGPEVVAAADQQHASTR